MKKVKRVLNYLGPAPREGERKLGDAGRGARGWVQLVWATF
jgi:hypothetical protein